MKTISVILLTLALIIESTITTIPLILLCLLTLTAVFREKFIFVLAFIFGLLLDLAMLKPVGFSSIIFEIYIFLIFMYQSKLEITTSNFIIVASFLGSVAFLLLNGLFRNIILESIVSTLVGIMIFIITRRLVKVKTND